MTARNRQAVTARMDLMTALETVGACREAREWLRAERKRRPGAKRSIERWEACPRGDWLLWLAAKAGVDRRMVVMAACAVAREALVHVPAGGDRPRRCIETAERWCRGEATIEDVRVARRTAAAAAHADADAADAAHAAAAYAAAAAAYAAAAAAADAAAAAAAAAARVRDTVRAQSLARSAEIVRSIVPWADVERGLYLAAGGVL